MVMTLVQGPCITSIKIDLDTLIYDPRHAAQTSLLHVQVPQLLLLLLLLPLRPPGQAHH